MDCCIQQLPNSGVNITHICVGGSSFTSDLGMAQCSDLVLLSTVAMLSCVHVVFICPVVAERHRQITVICVRLYICIHVHVSYLCNSHVDMYVYYIHTCACIYVCMFCSVAQSTLGGIWKCSH